MKKLSCLCATFAEQNTCSNSSATHPLVKTQLLVWQYLVHQTATPMKPTLTWQCWPERNLSVKSGQWPLNQPKESWMNKKTKSQRMLLHFVSRAFCQSSKIMVRMGSLCDWDQTCSTALCGQKGQSTQYAGQQQTLFNPYIFLTAPPPPPPPQISQWHVPCYI